MSRAKPKDPGTVTVAVRLPRDLVAEVDAYVERINHERPGMSATRTTGIRMLLHQALEATAAVSGQERQP